jgi:hypothetical protein
MITPAFGYTVRRLPREYEERLQDPLDDHLEAVTEGRNGYAVVVATMNEIKRIVEPHGRYWSSAGPSSLVMSLSITC